MGPERLAGSCYDKDTCPTIYERSATTVIVQGYLVDRGSRTDRSAVEIPVALLADAVTRWQQRHPAARPVLSVADAASSIERTATGTLLVEGAPVPVSELAVPTGEAAVAVPVYVLMQAAEEVTEHVA